MRISKMRLRRFQANTLKIKLVAWPLFPIEIQTEFGWSSNKSFKSHRFPMPWPRLHNCCMIDRRIGIDLLLRVPRQHPWIALNHVVRTQAHCHLQSERVPCTPGNTRPSNNFETQFKTAGTLKWRPPAAPTFRLMLNLKWHACYPFHIHSMPP